MLLIISGVRICGMQVSQAKRLKELEQENTRLKKVVANLTVDKLILQEVVQGK
jgi:putative transposase